METRETTDFMASISKKNYKQSVKRWGVFLLNAWLHEEDSLSQAVLLHITDLWTAKIKSNSYALWWLMNTLLSVLTFPGHFSEIKKQHTMLQN